MKAPKQMTEFEAYQERRIAYRGVQSTLGWNVKIYTITLNDSFDSPGVLDTVIENLGSAFISKTDTGRPVHKHAFLIVHEAREGVWILFNWWTGGEMLETILRFASYENPLIIGPSPYRGSLVCTWELEVITHERQAWIRHVLKQSNSPDFIGYQNDGLNGR